MSQINRTGTFRGIDVNRVIDESSGKHIQWVADLQATEYYDEETQQWVDWSEYTECEIRCWIMLFNKDASKEPFFGTAQLQKAGRWTGVSFQELREESPDGFLFQFNIIEDTYEGKTRLKVSRIDHYNAEPGRTLVSKLDNDDVKKLDAKYAAALRKLGGGPKPKTVPAKPVTPKPTIPTANNESAKAAMKAEMEKRAARSQAAEAKAKKKPGPKPKPQAPKAAVKDVETSTLEQAWEAVYAAKPEVMSDDDLGTKWLEVIDKYGDQDTLSPAEWAVVRDEVLAEIS